MIPAVLARDQITALIIFFALSEACRLKRRMGHTLQNQVIISSPSALCVHPRQRIHEHLKSQRI